VILVNRGFVPDSNRDPSTRREGQISGLTKLEGIVRFGERRNSFTPNNKPVENVWHWTDVATMAQYRHAQPILIDATADSTPPGGLPVGGQTRLTIRNEHLSYILTWYSLSVITFGMWWQLRKSPIKKVNPRRLPPKIPG